MPLQVAANFRLREARVDVSSPWGACAMDTTLETISVGDRDPKSSLKCFEGGSKGGALWPALWGNVSAPGIFLDPCPTGDLLGGALRGRT